MEIQVVLASIIAYLILFNSCLTFRLSRTNNLVVITLIFLNVTFVEKILGSLFIVPMFLTLVIYVGWKKKRIGF